MSVSIFVDGDGERFSIKRMRLRLFLVVSVSITGVLNIHEVKNILLLVLSKECLRKMDSFDLFAIKNWMVGRSGNKARETV